MRRWAWEEGPPFKIFNFEGKDGNYKRETHKQKNKKRNLVEEEKKGAIRGRGRGGPKMFIFEEGWQRSGGDFARSVMGNFVLISKRSRILLCRENL